MKKRHLLLLPLLLSGCFFPPKSTPLSQRPVGDWEIQEAYMPLRKRQRATLDVQGYKLKLQDNFRFEMRNANDEFLYTGKWQIAEFSFSVSEKNVSESDYKYVLAAFADDSTDFALLAEAVFYDKMQRMHLYDNSGETKKYYVLKKKH